MKSMITRQIPISLKIILGFLTSSIIITILVIFGFTSFIEIRKEIRYLELADNLRSKTLQLRRHEKNFFLYRELPQIKKVHRYLKDLNTLLQQGKAVYSNSQLPMLEEKLKEYEQRFNCIENLFWEIHKGLERIRSSKAESSFLFTLIESTFLERPMINANLLKKVFSLQPEDQVIKSLQKLQTEITALRKNGEEIISLANRLDKSALEGVERAIRISQTTAVILLPLFFLVGLWILFGISNSIVKRLRILSSAIEDTGKGHFSALDIPEKHDEVGLLIKAFNRMKADLVERDKELMKKNEELIQSRKLASIGTLASGVAHELNNPLNNIYLSAQILAKEVDGQSLPGIVSETVSDIFSQSLRVKKIVNDLLEFSREKSPQMERINLSGLINNLLKHSGMKYYLKTIEDVEILADRGMLEQVFINLFSNAREAMENDGLLNITLDRLDTAVQIKVSDTGKGMPPEDISRVFDPFFTTKEKGTGLGLAIVYNIIKKHQGEIVVESRLNKGTTFTITLPKEIL